MTERKDPPAVGYIVSSYKFKQHADYEAADNERKRLAAECPAKTFRVMKVVNCGGAVSESVLQELLANEQCKE